MSSLFGGFQGILFDAYGTLFDVSALAGPCAAVSNQPAAFSRLWRSKQLEYSVLRTVMDQYANFDQITSDALDYTATALGVDLNPAQRRSLMQAWLELPAYPDVVPSLEQLHVAGQRMVVLSNGTRHMLEPLIERAGLAAFITDVLTSERVQTFKPDPSIYALASERFHARMNELLFVTANGFDVAGAKAAAFTVCRVNRARLPLDPLGFEPDLVVGDLLELAQRLIGEPARR
jgi:2-haloacid dehalogenase